MSTLAHEPHHHQPSASPFVHVLDPDRARHDAAYDRLLVDMQARVDAHTYGDAPAFLVVMPNDTYAHFLDALPPEQRQHHQCRACRDFINRYAGLVKIQPDGSVVSLLWPETPIGSYGIYCAAVAVMRRMVESRPIAGAFLTDETRLGAAPHSDKKRLGHTWTHFSFVVPRSMRCDRSLQNAGQRMAELLDDARMLQRALDEYPAALCRQALELLSNGQLYRSDKCVDRARWLIDLHSAIETHGRRRRDALVWSAVATAPAGFAHVRSGMIGTLLDDLAAAKPFAEIKRAFDSKMSPTQYMRPTAAPSVGAIAQAERTMVELGLAPALARRFARVEEVDAIWRPAAPAQGPAASGGLFAHLLPTSPSRPGTVDATAAVSMTFAKFRSTVLPKAEAIELQVPYGRAGFSALVTAVNPDAPPILRWDHPVTNYCYSQGSDASTWNLAAGSWAKVTAITLDPGRWYGHEAGPHGSDRAFFLLQGAYDKRHTAGGGFFLEQLRGELHGVRSVLEAHANQAPISGRTEATACGLVVPSPGSAPLVRVIAAGVRTTYRIDRWD